LTSPPDPTNHDQQEPRRSIPTNLSTRPGEELTGFWLNEARLDLEGRTIVRD
jgi:hypothetical protein